MSTASAAPWPERRRSSAWTQCSAAGVERAAGSRRMVRKFETRSSSSSTLTQWANFAIPRSTSGISGPPGRALTTRAYETKSCSSTAADLRPTSPRSPEAAASSRATGSMPLRRFFPLRAPKRSFSADAAAAAADASKRSESQHSSIEGWTLNELVLRRAAIERTASSVASPATSAANSSVSAPHATARSSSSAELQDGTSPPISWSTPLKSRPFSSRAASPRTAASRCCCSPLRSQPRSRPTAASCPRSSCLSYARSASTSEDTCIASSLSVGSRMRYAGMRSRSTATQLSAAIRRVAGDTSRDASSCSSLSSPMFLCGECSSCADSFAIVARFWESESSAAGALPAAAAADA
mmetsp:Transcript_4220/g.14325  ORF Transcript_4220/g.14325 Transcript_4220/m.14325 type:complete len:354 (-) Transcript_4220:296-1357(-)